ncbi:hypothetical protein DPMN_165639 [Dreissena polymorpha]|uniref:Uncharacterized protein n=1 Tax=Dreissena polymorpha TaxID=45954 RepID=A0A9D4F0N2_DREPO|nr:hypothetical protein DPMN_165639 [Dreissena polymorpha]
MARQRPTRAPHVEIDRIVIRETILGACGLLWAGRPRVGKGAIHNVQYQFEVNRCRNEEIIVKGNFGWAWPMWAGRPRIEVQYQFEVNRCRNEDIIVKGNFAWAWPMWVWTIMGGAPQVEIYRIVIREVQYQLEVNRYNFGWVWPIMGGAPQVEINCIVIREVQYQFEVNRLKAILGAPGLVIGPCIAEIDRIVKRVKGNFEWTWPMWAGCPRIDRIVIREVHYQFEVNRCRNEEIIVKGNFGWAWPMWPGRPRIDLSVIREAQYQFEVNRCRNEEIIVKGNFGLAWPMLPGRPRIDLSVIREAQYQFKVNRCRNEEVNFQGFSANSVGEAGGQDGRTDAH